MTTLAVSRVRSLPFLRALAARDFRLLWGSEAISVVGDQFQFIALSWLVISLTGSGLALGTVLIAIAVPRAVLLVPFGVLADRRPSRGLMLTAHIVRGAVVGAMAALVLTETATLPLLALLGAVFGAADALYLPAQQAFLPRTLEPERLPSGNALLQGTMQLASIVGPPIAGAAIAVTSTGFAFAVDAASFLLAAVVIAMIHNPASGPAAAGADGTGPDLAADAAEPAADEPFVAAITRAIRYVLADKALRTTMLIALVLNFALNGPASVGMPWLADQRFDAGPAGLGIMAAALAAGALTGVIVAGSLSIERRGRSLLVAVVLTGLGELGVGVLPSLPAVVLSLAVDRRRDRLREHHRDLVDPGPRRPVDDRPRHEPRDVHGRGDHAVLARDLGLADRHRRDRPVRRRRDRDPADRRVRRRRPVRPAVRRPAGHAIDGARPRSPWADRRERRGLDAHLVPIGCRGASSRGRSPPHRRCRP